MLAKKVIALAEEHCDGKIVFVLEGGYDPMNVANGAEAVFVGSGIFESEDPSTVGKAIVEAATHFQDASILAKVSRGLGHLMPGLEIGKLDVKYAERGW